jgi:hypothetical protein
MLKGLHKQALQSLSEVLYIPQTSDSPITPVT